MGDLLFQGDDDGCVVKGRDSALVSLTKHMKKIHNDSIDFKCYSFHSVDI